MIPGDDLHLTLLMAPYNLNFLTGKDRQDLLAYARAVFAAGATQARGAAPDDGPGAYDANSTVPKEK